VLIAPLVATVRPIQGAGDPLTLGVTFIVVAVALVILGAAIWTSKKESFGAAQVEEAVSAQPLTPTTPGTPDRVGAPGGS
jgi:hypothetical protein